MKVLVISAAFPPMQAGEATNAYHLCQSLAGRGLDVHVLTSQGHDGVSECGITVHPLMRSWSWLEVPRLVSFLKRCSPDVVYMMYLGWTYDHQFMSTFVPTIAKRILPGVPFITRFENIGGAAPETNSFMSRMIRKALFACDSRGDVDYQFGTLLRDSESIVLLSGRHEAILEERLPGVSRKCVLIPPPVNMRMSAEDGGATRERGRKALGAAPDDFLLAYVGFIYPGKGIETLLHALEQVSRQRTNIRLAIIGGSLAREFPDRPSYLEEIQARARALGIEQNVVWTGEYRWDSCDGSTYLRAADACVLPFDTGVKLNNSSFSSAAAHGLPIITTQDEFLETQFVHGENVYLCPPKSAETLASAIASLIDDASLRRRLSEGSLQLAEDWYSWQAATDKTLALFPRHVAASPEMVLRASPGH